MTDKQQRYEQTEKGKAARARARANYQAKMVKWQCMVEPALNEALLAIKPEGMSNAAFLVMILEERVKNNS